MEEMFLHKDIRPASPVAEKLARAVLNLISAESDLAQARRNVPEYTAQYDYCDYFAQEQDNWNRAADSLLAAISVD